MKARVSLIRRTLAALSFLLITGCDGDRTSGPVAESPDLHLEAVSNTSIVATVGTTLDANPVVAVLDERGKPVSGILVTFQLDDGPGGAISYGMMVSDKFGRASAGNWTLSTYPRLQAVTASIGESQSSVIFRARTVADVPAKIISLDGTGDVALPNDTILIVAQITDRFGNRVGVAGIDITFTTSISGMSSPPVTLISNAKGLARFYWILGSEPVRNGLAITSPSLAGASHDVQIVDLQHTVVFDLMEVAGSPPGQRSIRYGLLALSDDGHFIDILVGAPDTELEGITRMSGDFEQQDQKVILKFSKDYSERASISGDDILVERWDPATYNCCVIWKYSKRTDF